MSEADKSHDVMADVGVAEKLRHQAELLQETQRRLDRASMSIQEGHWEVDLQTSRHWCSTSYLALLGLPQDSAACDTLEKVLNLIHPDERELVHVVTQRHFAGKAHAHFQVTGRTAGEIGRASCRERV